MATKMDLSRINAAAKPGTGLLPLMKLHHLKPSLYYQITNIYKAKTKFGEAIMVNVEGTHAGFLPPRMTKFFEANPKDLEELQIHAKNNQLLMVHVEGDGASQSHFQFAISEPIPAEMAIEVVEEPTNIKKAKTIPDYINPLELNESG